MLKLRKLRCSFCKRNEDEVAKLVAGPRVYICDQCVTVASRIMEGDQDDKGVSIAPTVWHKLTDRVRRLFHPGEARRATSLT
jgi:ATP-dependent protease Clp ATPase subunit